jgi:hypothetical protein
MHPVDHILRIFAFSLVLRRSDSSSALFQLFLGHPVQYTVTLIKRSMLGRGGAPCNGLYVQFVPCPFEYSSFLIACLDEYLLN